MRILAGLFLLAAFAWAGEAYYAGGLSDLEITEGELPKKISVHEYFAHHRGSNPYAALDGPGEVYVAFIGRPGDPMGMRLGVRVNEPRDVSGVIVLPKKDAMVRLRFRIAQAQLTAEKDAFRALKRVHYRRLLERRTSGAAWHRHQLMALSDKRELAEERGLRRERGDERTFDFYTGGLALDENLQLDRRMRGGKRADATVPIEGIKGITVAEFDWKPHLEGLDIAVDPLARMVPADQYAVFFPSFQAMLDLVDLADESGTPILHAMEPRAQDARTRARYERQLCLETDALSRVFGPELIDAVVFTGSDPYLRTGTDVAVLFQAKQPAALATILKARRKAKAGAAAAESTATIAGHEIHVLKTPDRRVHSLMAQTAGAVVVSNSPVQMARILDKEAARLADSPEYKFFRKRYRRGEAESALLVIPDAAIRKWCGPKWRIASSRRVRAAATLAELHAEHRDALLAGTKKDGLDAWWAPVNCGELHVEGGLVHSSIYGTREFQTPIAELEVTHATEDEARFYRMWRDGYERNWSNFFDPIAVRFTTSEKRIAADVTVMPLIVATEYGKFLDVVRGAKIGPDGGDRHPEAIVQWAIAVNAKSEAVREWGEWLKVMGRFDAHPFSWLGSSASIYVDRDPLFDEAARAEDPQEFLEGNLHRLPVALYCEVQSPLKLTMFLTTLRAFAQQSAPGMTKWENLEHNGQPYVRISPTQGDGFWEKLRIYYVTMPNALIVTPNEAVLKRAIDRHRPREEGQPNPERGAPWLGEHVCLQAKAEVLTVFEQVFGPRDGLRAELQRRAWDNLPILNEWRRLYPDRDPVDVHERLFGVRLVCPGGGRYAWDPEWRTMSSTEFGHPGAPKEGPQDVLPLAGWKAGGFGLTFEKDGLRAVCELRR